MVAMANNPGGWAQWPPIENHRTQTRYELSLDLVCQPIDGSHNWYQGVGKTIDLSSTGALIELDRTLSPGERIECCVNWPMPVDRPPKNLIIDGIVVRTDGNRAAISFIRRYFISEAERARRMSRRAAYRTA